MAILRLPTVVCLAVGAWLVQPAASTNVEAGEAISAVAEAGRAYYGEYCAACHGPHGRGDGPVAAELRVRPPDLTEIAKRRSGAFPLAQLAALIDGREPVAAHGSGEMPVWGEVFAAEYAGDARQREIVQGKMLMLLFYLESIQR